jgi:Pyridoxamine 5'-phosphate oxidase
MAKFFPELTASQSEFVARQKIYFVASAPSHGRVNLSPKGMDTFRVLTSQRLGYLDATGSGNETAAHLRENGRLTIMFCAFEDAPLILRVYARSRSVQPRDAEWAQLRPLFGPPLPGERQLIIGEIESVQTSCGYAVPFFDYQREREQLIEWAEKKGADGLAAYHAEKNQRSIDGLPTGLKG